MISCSRLFGPGPQPWAGSRARSRSRAPNTPDGVRAGTHPAARPRVQRAIADHELRLVHAAGLQGKTQFPLAECLVLGLPSLGQPLDRARREPRGVLAEQIPHRDRPGPDRHAPLPRVPVVRAGGKLTPLRRLRFDPPRVVAEASGVLVSLARSCEIEGQEEAVLDVERWAELRREHFVRGVSIKELMRRTGLARNTIRAALRSPEPPGFRCPVRPSKLDPFKDEIHVLLRRRSEADGGRIRELIEPLGFDGGKSIVDDYLREVRPLFLAPRTFQRTVYRPGEICQFDLWQPAR
jgi:hypothetical protein